METIDLENNFFDRQNILGLLKKRVVDLKDGYRQNVALLGSQHIGKSSILRKFITDLDDPDIVAIYLDLEEKDFNYLFNNFVGNILYSYLVSKKLQPQEDVSLLIENTKKYLPQTVEAIKKAQIALSKKKIAESYRQLISISETFTLESGKFCIIVFDEFHCLEDLVDGEAFQELGKRIMTQKRCLYLMASSLQNIAKRILSEKLSLLFGHFEIIEVEPFTLKISQGFIDSCLREVQISDHLRNFLIDFTGGHPFYLNIFTSELCNLCKIHQQKEIFLPILSQAIENTIFNRWGVLSLYFESSINSLSLNKGSKDTCNILIALANQKHKIEEIVESTDLKKSLVSQKMSRLIELGVVEKGGTFYYLKDKLFRYWIKYILQKRLHTVGYDAQNQREQFRLELSKAVADFQSKSQQELSSRIVELLRSFDNEMFSFRGRRYRLASFHQIKLLKVQKESARGLDMIKAYAADGAWLIMLNEESLSEAEIISFLEESKKLNFKPQRRIIISLKELENSIRLRALQEKMWVWSEGELNLLLNMHDKPYIVK